MNTITLNPPMVRSLLVMATMIEARDPYTGGHTWRVSQYARKLAEAVGLGAGAVYLVTLGALVHDVGKIGIPDGILKKPDKLSEVEFEIIQKHPDIGEILVHDHPLGALVDAIIRQHHERVDGTGYPNALGGDQISLYARIVSIADAFDAMTSARPYRQQMAVEKALGILQQGQGKQFDAALTGSFADMVHKGIANHIIGHSSENHLLLTCSECGPTISIQPGYKNGDPVICPACTGIYHLHPSGETYEVEFSGMLELTYVPNPDLFAIESLIQQTPSELKVEPI